MQEFTVGLTFDIPLKKEGSTETGWMKETLPPNRPEIIKMLTRKERRAVLAEEKARRAKKDEEKR